MNPNFVSLLMAEFQQQQQQQQHHHHQQQQHNSGTYVPVRHPLSKVRISSVPCNPTLSSYLQSDIPIRSRCASSINGIPLRPLIHRNDHAGHTVQAQEQRPSMSVTVVQENLEDLLFRGECKAHFSEEEEEEAPLVTSQQTPPQNASPVPFLYAPLRIPALERNSDFSGTPQSPVPSVCSPSSSWQSLGSPATAAELSEEDELETFLSQILAQDPPPLDAVSNGTNVATCRVGGGCCGDFLCGRTRPMSQNVQADAYCDRRCFSSQNVQADTNNNCPREIACSRQQCKR